jgi:hypothetical protein
MLESHYRQLTVRSRSAHGTLTVSSRLAHGTLTVSSRLAHGTLTVSSRYTHGQGNVLCLYSNASVRTNSQADVSGQSSERGHFWERLTIQQMRSPPDMTSPNVQTSWSKTSCNRVPQGGAVSLPPECWPRFYQELRVTLLIVRMKFKIQGVQ